MTKSPWNWRVELVCGHRYLLERAPDLRNGLICAVEECRRLGSIVKAERVPADGSND